VLESVEDTIRDLEKRADNYSFSPAGYALTDPERKDLFAFVNERVDGLRKRQERVRRAYDDLRGAM